MILWSLSGCDGGADDESASSGEFANSGEFDGPASGFVRTAEIVRGRQLFIQNGCHVCHGKGGRGDGKIAHTLDPRPGDLADRSTFERGWEIGQIMKTIEKGIGVRKIVMPGYRHLAERDRRRLALFIRSLSDKSDNTHELEESSE